MSDGRTSQRFCFCKPVLVALLLAAIAGVPRSSTAQTTTTFGAIEGTVTDDTGGVLPGVTLTLTSPALQVPQMTAVSDTQGRYRWNKVRQPHSSGTAGQHE